MPKVVKNSESAVGRFTKVQLLASKRYINYRDVLAAILSEKYFYSHDEVDAMIHDFMDKGV